MPGAKASPSYLGSLFQAFHHNNEKNNKYTPFPMTRTQGMVQCLEDSSSAVG